MFAAPRSPRTSLRLWILDVSTVAGLFALTSLAIALAAGGGGPAVFINEIHYDNTGTDTGEFIEIAGPAGTDFSGYAIKLYNGANGLLYDTDPLSGTIPNQQNGFGTVVLIVSDQRHPERRSGRCRPGQRHDRHPVPQL